MSTRAVRSLQDVIRHGYGLDVECGCGHKATLDARVVYHRFSDKGWSTSLIGGFLDDPYLHFRCSKCGGRPKHIGPMPR